MKIRTTSWLESCMLNRTLPSVRWIGLTLLLVLSTLSSANADDGLGGLLAKALERAADNRGEIQAALDNTPAEQMRGMRFLVAYMPERDLKTLKSSFLRQNVDVAYKAWRSAKWSKAVPEEIFLNNILPYANINESRDNWRSDFYKRFQPLVADAKTPGEAATILNRKIFPLLKVKYSTKRRRADQGPLETMESGLASCTGLSILLIDACRSVGVPARFVGTPLWSDRSGNHSWVEVWDNGWHFTGAAEPTGDQLDRAWFLGRASKADRAHRFHAIYAVSYKQTPQSFPMVWARNAEYISAVNVTDRYTSAAKKLPDGWARIMFQAYGLTGDRCCASIKVQGEGGVVFQGKTNDERFDRNDHVTAELKLGESYQVEFDLDGKKVKREFKVGKDGQLISVDIGENKDAEAKKESPAKK